MGAEREERDEVAEAGATKAVRACLGMEAKPSRLLVMWCRTSMQRTVTSAMRRGWQDVCLWAAVLCWMAGGLVGVVLFCFGFAGDCC